MFREKHSVQSIIGEVKMFYYIDTCGHCFNPLSVIYEFLLYAGVPVPGKPFQPSLVFVDKARTYPSEAPQMLPSRVGSYPYPQTLEQAGNVC